MTYDLKIAGGTVFDGTGSAGVPANVAIRDGRIVEIGECSDTAKRTIGARGAIVTPGFVDLHCHYDGQVSWDAEMMPSSIHGVTTCLVGNCGVGFAPVRSQDHTRLIRLMEGVEDIPGAALAEGIRWGWESFAEYIDVIDGIPRTIDVGLQVPHDALRLFVMGDRAEQLEAATPADVEQMRTLLRAALEAGAWGFSTGRTDNHRSADGHATPASEARRDELVGVARAFEGLGHGVLQAVSDFDMEQGPSHFDAEFDLLEAMAAAAGGHPTSLSLLQRDQASDQWRRILERVERANGAHVPMRVQVATRPIGVLLGFEATFHPFMGFPTYKSLAHLPIEERVRRMREPEIRARILSERSEPVAGDGSPIPPLADKLLENIDFVAMRLFTLGERPNYEPDRANSIFAQALAREVPPLAAVYDAMVAGDGRALLYFPLYNYTDNSLDAVREMMLHPLALVSLSDGGAHVGTVCDASYGTFMLQHWTRDRPHDRIAIERAVQLLTSIPAAYLGLHDRGVLRPGMRADLNVIDLANLALESPKLVHDLPAGGRRLIQRAHGYRATIVRGEVILENDQLTGARPGRVVRPTTSVPTAASPALPQPK